MQATHSKQLGGILFWFRCQMWPSDFTTLVYWLLRLAIRGHSISTFAVSRVGRPGRLTSQVY